MQATVASLQHKLRSGVSLVISPYTPRYALTLVAMLGAQQYRALPYLRQYWNTQDFSRPGVRPVRPMPRRDMSLVVVLGLGMSLQILAALSLAYLWLYTGLAGGWAFALAVFLSYPLVWAHVLAAAAVATYVAAPKRLGRAVVCRILEGQVRALRRRHDFTVVAVAGSVGKTSTKLAIARLLAAEKRVMYQDGNYNDRVTVPLILFGQEQPASLLDVRAWLRIFRSNADVIKHDYPYDVAVVELGTDGPGQLQAFAYVQPDLTVVTAVAEEHMEFFGTLDAVAKEELSVAAFSKRLLVNGDDIAPDYLAGMHDYTTYGVESGNDYRATYSRNDHLHGETVDIHIPNGKKLQARITYVGLQGVKIFVGAFAVADMLGISRKRIVADAHNILPSPGRLQILAGKQDATLIDDTYNASPVAMKAALDVLYTTAASKRIAILGTMNELGASSEVAHREIGAYCNPEKLDLVVTIGHDANEYLAPEAEAKGCTVVRFDSPVAAGTYVAERLKSGCVVLGKGSQNGVFAEEALKLLLDDPADAARLVRQSPQWMRKKRAQFSDLAGEETVAGASA